MVICCVEGCKRELVLGSGLSMHRFPTDPELKRKWLEVVPAKVTKYSVVCSLHFKPEDFSSSGSFRRKLKHDSIPSLFPVEAWDAERLSALAGSIPVKGREDEAAILEECLDGIEECRLRQNSPQLAAKNLAEYDLFETKLNMNRLPACRVCLAYNTRLCSMMDGQLRDIYETLVASSSLDTEDMLPKSACYICLSFMKKILKFRDRWQKANQILQQMIISGLEPSVSSLDMLVKDQTGISWNLEISDIYTTTTTAGDVEFNVKIEPIKSEMDIDGMSDRNEDYSDSMPVFMDSTSDFIDDLPLQSISQQCKTNQVNIEETLREQNQKSSGHEGAAPPQKRKFDKNEAKDELVDIQAPLRKPEKDEEPIREEIEDISNILDFRKISKTYKSPFKTKFKRTETTTSFIVNKISKTYKSPFKTKLKDTETTTSNIINKKQNDSSFNKNDTVTPAKDIFTCDLCKGEYRCKTLLVSHMKKSHVIELNRKDSINSDLNVTNECNRTNLLKVQESQNNDSRKKNDRRENKCSDNTNQFECEFCMKRFISNFDLTVHTRGKPFKCDMCGKCFSSKAYLTTHIRNHMGEISYSCSNCNKIFSSRGALTRHFKVHTKEKPFKCDTCEKCFAESWNLANHLRVHTKEKPFKCNICEKSFSESSALTKHIRTHTKEMPFKCDICEKCFPVSGRLTKHLRVHTKEKPFKCDICEKCFSQRESLTTHKRIHTGDYSCSYCDKTFSNRRYLQSHLKFHTKDHLFSSSLVFYLSGNDIVTLTP